MTGKAKIVDVAHRDCDAADGLVAKAREHMEDARRPENHGSSRFLLAYQAALDLANATLRAAAKRVGSGPAGHVVRIECCIEQMPSAKETWERVEDARQRRNRLTYEGEDADVEIVEEFVGDLGILIGHVTEFIQDQRAVGQYELGEER